MTWYKIVFPDDAFPFDEPTALVGEAQKVYERNDFPEGFVVYLETQYIPVDGGTDVKAVYYFSPVAAAHCDELFKSYRGHPCDEHVYSGQPITALAGDLNWRSFGPQ